MINNYKLCGVLVDIGATLNVCSLDILHLIELIKSQLCLVALTVSGYYNNKKMALGKITIGVTIGPLQTNTELIIVDASISYRLILGRQWIEEIKAVTSPRHQCMKFSHQGKIIKILGDEPIEVEAHLVTVPTTTSAPSIRDSAAEVVNNVKRIFTPRSTDMD